MIRPVGKQVCQLVLPKRWKIPYENHVNHVSLLKRTPPGRSELAKTAEESLELDDGDDQEFEAKAMKSGLCELLKNISNWLSCCFETAIVHLHIFKFSEVKINWLTYHCSGERFWFVAAYVAEILACRTKMLGKKPRNKKRKEGG